MAGGRPGRHHVGHPGPEPARRAYSPALNPAEKLWRFLRERLLRHRVLRDLDAVIDAACDVLHRLGAEPGRARPLTAFPWLPRSVSNLC